MATEPGQPSRFGAYSDFWTRYLNWGVSHCPWAIEPILVALYSFCFFLLARQLREGIWANLKALFPEASTPNLAFKTCRVFWNFAAVAVDGVRAREQPSIIEWEVAGLPHFEKACQIPGGIVIITAHMGNYDLAGAVFAKRFGRPINAVRAPERNAALQTARKAELTSHTDYHYHIIYNEPGSMLGITLTQALQRREAVAIQADRVLFGVSPMTLPWSEDLEMDIPQGPFILSLTTGCPLFPLFMIRLGRCRYRVEIGEAFHCRRTGLDKEADLQRAGLHWIALLRDVIERHWDQWLVVEPNLKAKPRQPSRTSGIPAPAP